MARLLHALVLASLALAVRADDEKGHCSAIGFGRLATDAGQTLIAHTDDRRVRLLVLVRVAWTGGARCRSWPSPPLALHCPRPLTRRPCQTAAARPPTCALYACPRLTTRQAACGRCTS